MCAWVPKVRGHSAGGGLVNRAASTPTPPPNPSKGQAPGTSGPTEPTRPDPSVATALDPTPRRLDGRHSTKAGSCASNNQGNSSVAPVPKAPRESSSRTSASPGRCGGPVVRACAHCGTRTEKCKLKECSACRSVRYCGKACQKADWPLHNATCKSLRTT